MAFERVDVTRPEPAERDEPVIQLHERLGSQPVDTALGIDADVDEARLPQHAEMLRDRRLRHVEPALELADGPLGGGEQREHGAAIWFRQNREGRFHAVYIPIRVYARQG